MSYTGRLIPSKDSVNHNESLLRKALPRGTGMLHVSVEGAVASVSVMRKIDQVIAEAQLLREGVVARIKEQQKRLKDIEDTIKKLEEVRAAAPADMLDSLFGNQKTPRETNPEFFAELEGALPPRTLSPQQVAQRARDALLQVGHPLKRGQLVKTLEGLGVPLSGADKNKNLGTIMWRHEDMFVSLPSLGYWVKGVPLDGVYDPEELAKEEEESAYAQYREMKLEDKRIQADQGSAVSAARRETLLMEQRRLAERYPSFPDRWQADLFR